MFSLRLNVGGKLFDKDLGDQVDEETAKRITSIVVEALEATGSIVYTYCLERKRDGKRIMYRE